MPSKEVEMRRLLPDGVVMYTGDDFNYAELIAGDDKGFSHGLLGIFDPIAPAAAAAFARLEAGDRAGYHAILDPTVALSRRLFEAPTQYYKCGVVLLAWLNGFQEHISAWSAARNRRVASCITPISSGSPTRPVCSPIPSVRHAGWPSFARSTASPDALAESFRHACPAPGRHRSTRQIRETTPPLRR
jgi:hypothetical protein